MATQAGGISIGVGLDLSQLKSDKQTAKALIDKFRKELTTISLRGVVIDKSPFKSVIDSLQAGKDKLKGVFDEWSSSINKTNIDMGKFATKSKANSEKIIKEWVKLQNSASKMKNALRSSRKDFDESLGLKKFADVQEKYILKGKKAFKELFQLQTRAKTAMRFGTKMGAPVAAGAWLGTGDKAERKAIEEKLAELRGLGPEAKKAVDAIQRGLNAGDRGIKVSREKIVKQLDVLRVGVSKSLKKTKLSTKEFFIGTDAFKETIKSLRTVSPKVAKAVGEFEKALNGGLKMSYGQAKAHLSGLRALAKSEGADLAKLFSKFGATLQKGVGRQRALDLGEEIRQAKSLTVAKEKQSESLKRLLIDEKKLRAQVKVGNNAQQSRIAILQKLRAQQEAGLRTTKQEHKIKVAELAIWSREMKAAKDVVLVKNKQIAAIRKLRIEEERLRTIKRAGLGTLQTELDLGKNLNTQLKLGAGLTEDKVREAKKLKALIKATAASGDTGFLSGAWIKSRARWFIQLRGFWAIWRGMVNTFEMVKKLEEELANLQAVTQATTAQFLVMKDSIMDVAKVLGVPIETLASGMVKLGQAGLSTEEVARTIKDVGTLAVATITDMTTASDLITTVMRSWTKEARNTTRITDILAKTVNKSKATIKGLSQTFQYLTGILPQLNVQFRDTAAMIGIMANKGIKMSKIGTGLRSLMGELVRPSERFRKQLAKVGLTTSDVDASTTDLVTVLERLSSHGFNAADALKGLDRRAASAVSALIKGAGSIRSFSESLDDAGAASRMAATQMESLNRKVDLMRNKFAILFSGLYDYYKPALKASVDVLGKMAEGTSELGDAWKKVFKTIGTVGIAVGVVALGKGLLKIKKLLPGIAGFLTRVTVGLKSLFMTPAGLAAIAVVAGLTYLITKLSQMSQILGILEGNVNKARAATVKATIKYKELAEVFEKHRIALEKGDRKEAARLEAGNEKLRQLSEEAKLYGNINKLKEKALAIEKKRAEAENENYKQELGRLASELRRDITKDVSVGSFREEVRIANELFSLSKATLSKEDILSKIKSIKSLFSVMTEEILHSIRTDKEELDKSIEDIMGISIKNNLIKNLRVIFKDNNAILRVINEQVEATKRLVSEEQSLLRHRDKVKPERKKGFFGEEKITGDISPGAAKREYEQLKKDYKFLQTWEDAHPEWLKQVEKIFREDIIKGNEVVRDLFKIAKDGRRDAMMAAKDMVVQNAKNTGTYKDLLWKGYEVAKKDKLKSIEALPTRKEIENKWSDENIETALLDYITLTPEAQVKAQAMYASLFSKILPKIKIKKTSWAAYLIDIKKLETEIEALGDTQSAVEKRQAKLEARRMQLQKQYGTLVKGDRIAELEINEKMEEYKKSLTKQDIRNAFIESRNIQARISALRELNPFEKERVELQHKYLTQAKAIRDKHEPEQAEGLVKDLAEEKVAREKLIDIKEKNYNVELAGQAELLKLTRERTRLELEEPNNKMAILKLQEKELANRRETLLNMNTERLYGMDKLNYTEKLLQLSAEQVINLDKQYRQLHPFYDAYKKIEESVSNISEFTSKITYDTAQTVSGGLSTIAFDLTGGFQAQRQEVVNLKSELKGLAEEYDEAISQNDVDRAKELKDNMAGLKNEIKDLKNPIKNLGDAFKSMFKDIIDGVRKAIIKMLIMKAISAGMGWLNSGAGGMGATETFSGVMSESPYTIPKATGGILPELKSFRSFSSGGMVANPTLALLGEKSKKEIVLPVSNIKSDSASGYLRDSSAQEQVINVINVLSENDIAQVMAGTTGEKVIINTIGKDLQTGGPISRQMRL